ncbi:hypothetical protein B484DRAFT_203572 [Ochromonadaceae sp. CCMP2298]|nr:hypothetical protein B484DRAFT_203572 [Ochromonadaceae sp. CCMP2298]
MHLRRSSHRWLIWGVVAYDLSVRVVHSWLRALLYYHSPTLVQHLDRVLPHWEDPAVEISSQQAVHLESAHRRNAELDALEMELGLDVLDSSPGMGQGGQGGNSPGQGSVGGGDEAEPVIESAPPSTYTRMGCLPTHWITGLFCGSVPPAQGLLLLDWALVSRCRYAGVFLTAALLEIYSQSLLQMGGSRVKQWFEEVSTNKRDWYRNLSVSEMQGAGEGGIVPDWDTFTAAWVHTAAALVASTPQAFKDSLDNTAAWAQARAEHGESPSSGTSVGVGAGAGSTHGSVGGLSQHAGSTHSTHSHSDHSSGKPAEADPESVGEEGEGEGELEGWGEAEGGIVFGGKVNLMKQFRKLSMHLSENGMGMGMSVAGGTGGGSGGPLSRYLQQERANTKLAPVVLWASAEEVVPCICSNRRRPAPIDSLLKIFHNRAFGPPTGGTGGGGEGSEGAGGVLLTFAPPHTDPHTRPFYFAVDCRSAAERSLGQFPKALAFDPMGLTEGEELQR